MFSGRPITFPRNSAGSVNRGFDGVSIISIDYVRELPYFIQEVIPRLENCGLRHPLSTVRFAS